MKISVIVPYEGYYQYLKDCLESLSEQENVEIETLLVGSQDDQKFQQLVDTYKDKISLDDAAGLDAGYTFDGATSKRS